MKRKLNPRYESAIVIIVSIVFSLALLGIGWNGLTEKDGAIDQFTQPYSKGIHVAKMFKGE